MSTRHELKTVNPWFQMVIDDEKTFDIRVNDRDFQPGDELLLREYNPETQQYSDRAVFVEILSVTLLDDILAGLYNLPKKGENLVIMSIGEPY